MNHIDFTTAPDKVLFQLENEWVKPKKAGATKWRYGDAELSVKVSSGSLDFYMTAESTPVKRIIARKICDIEPEVMILGDHWERGYGDLKWETIVPGKVLPWYFLITDGVTTECCGVKTGAASMCFWQVCEHDITLCMDIRCGGSGVVLSGRTLHAATVVTRQGARGETPFNAAVQFCKMMCDKPKLPAFPVYGGNNWYYAYGKSTRGEIIGDAKRISQWAASSENRPFMVIDAGWQQNLPGGFPASGGPWYKGNELFPDMEGLAHEMKELGARPGIWYRALLTKEEVPRDWLFCSDRFADFNAFFGEIMDPSIPDVLEHIGKDIARLKNWGFELIKHDFSTFDIFNRWGFAMSSQLTDDGWAFSDRGKTSAEIIKNFYKVIAENAGESLIIGCNTVGHLAAGLFQIQRTGDDTSGQHWERTRKMGVNTLAFRMPQHNSFYFADADCAGITKNVPWEQNKLWLDLLAKSGTPLFISASPDALGAEQEREIIRAFDIASKPLPAGEPLGWTGTSCPSKWRLCGDTTEYNWYAPDRPAECGDI
ncbi:MAG: alpha-galactosidase [Oscillospiraceae bacterium]|nr:alpha-galactosidase [Oscillospiraceae bacterium]